jgi:prolyl oligopeptidase
MDSLRSVTTVNGRYNTTEFGTVEDPMVFNSLMDYSPYHNVKDGTDYPAVLLTAGENDSRVGAWHAKKVTARLQAATTSVDPYCCDWSPAATSQAPSTRASTRPPTSTQSSSTN